MTLNKISSYARLLRPRLTPSAFAPARSRLLWLPVHLANIAFATAALSRHWLPWAIAPLLSLLIGGSFAGLTFLAHETLHGAVLRGARARRFLGWLAFLPFVISPRLWTAWHNRVHHGNTNRAGLDPDAYPTLSEYGRSRAVRVATGIAPGRRRARGVLSLLFGFSVQSTHMLFVATSRCFLRPAEHLGAVLETALGIAFWAALAVAIGAVPFLFAFVLPLLIANAIVMSFILTNHSLSPLTGINDPLANSLSVTLPRVLEWLTLGFGYHVEHHLFPAMSARHAPRVRDALLVGWPERYQSMPLGTALRALHASPRVYKTATLLVDPHSGSEWPALGSGP